MKKKRKQEEEILTSDFFEKDNFFNLNKKNKTKVNREYLKKVINQQEDLSKRLISIEQKVVPLTGLIMDILDKEGLLPKGIKKKSTKKKEI